MTKQKLLMRKTFNNFFCNDWANSCIKIPKSDTNFEAYIGKANPFEDKCLEAFKPLKINKTPGFDDKKI